MKNNKVVLTYYYTGEADFWHTERPIIKKPDTLDFLVLRKSLAQFPDWDFHTLANEFEPNWDYTKITKPEGMTFFVHKFMAAKKWIEEHPEYEWIWIVDTSDTQMLQEPQMQKDIIYTGYDCWSRIRGRYQSVKTLINGGFRKFKHSSFIHDSLRQWAQDPCYNCGVTGGHRDILLQFLADLEELMLKYPADLEMVTYNYLIFSKYKRKTSICTTKLNNWVNDLSEGAWWRHK